MYCSECGSEIPEGGKFCTECGSRVISTTPPDKEKPSIKEPAGTEETQEISPPPTTGAAAPPTVTGAAPRASAKGKGMSDRTKMWLAIGIPVALLVIAGAVVGIVLGLSSGSSIRAEVKRVDLTLEDGEEVDLDEVPLGKDLMLSVDYLTEFPEDAEGTLEIEIVDSDDKELAKKRIKCKSSKEVQTYEYSLTMPDTMSEIDVDAMAGLEIEEGDNKETDDKTLSFTTEKGEAQAEGDVDEAALKSAFDQAAGRLQEAHLAIQDLSSQKIDTGGLSQYLDKSQFLLNNGTTVPHFIGESDSALFYANYVINECNARKQAAAAQAEQARQQKPQPRADYIVCPTCGGTGWISTVVTEEYWVTCPLCMGEGGYYTENGWFTCAECGGTGGWYEYGDVYYDEICPTCGGTGWIIGLMDQGDDALATGSNFEGLLALWPSSSGWVTTHPH